LLVVVAAACACSAFAPTTPSHNATDGGAWTSRARRADGGHAESFNERALLYMSSVSSKQAPFIVLVYFSPTHPSHSFLLHTLPSRQIVSTRAVLSRRRNKNLARTRVLATIRVCKLVVSTCYFYARVFHFTRAYERTAHCLILINSLFSFFFFVLCTSKAPSRFHLPLTLSCPPYARIESVDMSLLISCSLSLLSLLCADGERRHVASHLLLTLSLVPLVRRWRA
jgi:hypothetical protein